jgi:type I restriction-modification system DNA methylase subunit
LSEELAQIGALSHGLIVGSYEFYNLGDTTLGQLRKAKIISDQDYGAYNSRKPDALLVDRRDLQNIKVICLIENKAAKKFKTKKDRKKAVEECNELCAVLNADVGIATDLSNFIWFNPRQTDQQNAYKDSTTGTSRSYSLIKDDTGNDFVKEFVIDQKHDEPDFTKLNVRTRKSLQSLIIVRKSVSATNSQLTKESTIDPTTLATQIWQDVWTASGATPEKCLYTFLELFIFKYLSDLKLLQEDDKGNTISFDHIYSLGGEKAFKNYTQNVRPYLKVMFPQSPEDKTTIINGTVLDSNVPEHGAVFYKILKRLHNFPEMKNIDPSFKSKVFEEFMKETISKKNWGQFFTPRRIIDAIVEMSDIDKLPDGAEICDPACGVGGFILEPLKVRENGVDFYYQIIGDEIKSKYVFHGYDKGFEKDEQLVIILAKANMLIFLSDLLKQNPTLVKKFGELFNSTFKLLSNTILGTLAKAEYDRYDLILTNPPYVTSGSSNYKDAIKADSEKAEFYKVNGAGVESLFLEWVIRSLKADRKAFVIVPDGLLNRIETKVRNLVREECIIDGIVSLPVNAFYRNPKKTYILAITKKHEATVPERKSHIQTEPIFTYLVNQIGETKDVKRFPIEEDDLPEMVSLFNQFKGAKKTFKSTSLHCKIQPIDKFSADAHWSVDRWWTKEEKVELKVEEEDTILTLEELKERVTAIEQSIHQFNQELALFS